MFREQVGIAALGEGRRSVAGSLRYL